MSHQPEYAFPRLLVTGVPFGYRNGSGVTLSNLLKGWPRDRIANAAVIEADPGWDVCGRFYRYGASEFRWRFPLSRLVRLQQSGPLTPPQVAVPDRAPKPSHWGRLLHPRLRRALYERASGLLGSLEVLNTVRLSHGLERWVSDFRPQVALTFFSTLNTMRLTESILTRFRTPYVVLINDDWASSIYHHGLLSRQLRSEALDALARLLRDAGAAVGVSPAMCEAYERRYGRPFQWFSGPVELARLLPLARKTWRAGDPFRLLYAGRVGRANTTSLIDVCRSVSRLREAGHRLVFDLYVTVNADLIRSAASGEDGIRVHAPLSYNETAALYAGADVLVLPLDFDNDSIGFARYSMSTKIAEYAAAAVPILVYAPGEIAMSSYAEREGWGYVVSERSPRNLEQAILRLAGDEQLREKLGRRALDVAQRDHDAATVRERFRKLLWRTAHGERDSR